MSGRGGARELLLAAFSRMAGVCTAKPGGRGSCQAGTCAAATAVGPVRTCLPGLCVHVAHEGADITESIPLRQWWHPAPPP